MATLVTCTAITRPAEGEDGSAVGDMLYETDTAKTIVCSNATGPVFKEYVAASSPYDLDDTNTVSVRPLFHFNADDIPAQLDGSAFTTQWTDRAHGKTTDAQSDGAAQPKYYTTGTNSKPYLYFDGADGLELTYAEGLRPGEPFTLFGLASCAGIGAGNNLLLAGDTSEDAGTNAGIWLFYGGATPKDYLFHGSTGQDNDTPPAWVGANGGAGSETAEYDQTRAFFAIRDSSDNHRLYVDGNHTNASLVSTAARGILLTHIGRVGDHAGTIYYTKGNVYDVAVWNSDLSTADRNALLAYAATKLGITKLDF